jgi:hypothetical protein
MPHRTGLLLYPMLALGLAMSPSPALAGPMPGFAAPGIMLDASRVCSPAFRPVEFCREVREGCRAATGSRNCWEFGYGRQARRASDPANLARATDKAAGFLKAILADPYAVEQCCGEDPGCAARLRKTRLTTFKTSENGIDAYFRDGEIRFLEARLLNYLTESGIEQAVLHELGHACEFARHPDRAADLANSCAGGDAAVEKLAWEDMTAVFGPAATACMRRGLHRDRDRRARAMSGICMSSWAQEAFADALYAAWYRRPEHWAWMCNAVVDPLHGATTEVETGCIMNDALAYNRFCPGRSAASSSTNSTPLAAKKRSPHSSVR